MGWGGVGVRLLELGGVRGSECGATSALLPDLASRHGCVLFKGGLRNVEQILRALSPHPLPSLRPSLLLAELQSRGSAAAADRIPHGGQKQRNILFEPHAAAFDSPPGCETDGAAFPVFPVHFLWIPQPAQCGFFF